MPELFTSSLQKRYVPLPTEKVFAYRHAFQVLAKLLTAQKETAQTLNHETSVPAQEAA